MRWLGLVCLVLVGCIEPQLQPCGELLCPLDSVCLPDHTCASKESIDVCTNMPDGATCTTSLYTGSCELGVCRPAVCGDNVVSGSEQCDGSAPIQTDCVSYGFDTGVPTCSDRCGLDVVGSCVRFGWERVLPQPTLTARADNGRFLVVSDDKLTLRLYEGTTLLQEHTIDPTKDELSGHIDIKGAIAVAGLYGAYLRSDNGGPFVEIPIDQLSSDYVTPYIGDDGSIYAGELSDVDTAIFRQAPGATTWQTVLTSTRLPSHFTLLGNTLYMAWDDGELQSWNPGGTWTHVLTAPSAIYFVSQKPGGGLYLTTYNTGAFEAQGSTLVPYGDQSVSEIYPVGNQVFYGGDDNVVYRQSGINHEFFNAPIYGSLATDGKDIYIYGNGIYRFTRTTFTNRDGSGLPAHDVKLLADGEPAMVSTMETMLVVGAESWRYDTPPDLPIAIAGASGTDVYVALPDQIVHWDTVNYTSITVPGGAIEPLDLGWDPATPSLYVVGKAGLAKRHTGGTWTTLTGVPSSCDITELALQGASAYAVATCGSDGVIYKLAGTAFSEVHRVATGLVALSVDAADNIYAAGKTTSVTRVGGAWNDLAGPGGSSISATKASDIWVAGGPDDLAHWDGTQWSRVRIEGAASPKVLATDDAIYLCGASQSVLIR